MKKKVKIVIAISILLIIGSIAYNQNKVTYSDNEIFLTIEIAADEVLEEREKYYDDIIDILIKNRAVNMISVFYGFHSIDESNNSLKVYLNSTDETFNDLTKLWKKEIDFINEIEIVRDQHYLWKTKYEVEYLGFSIIENKYIFRKEVRMNGFIQSNYFFLDSDKLKNSIELENNNHYILSLSLNGAWKLSGYSLETAY